MKILITVDPEIPVPPVTYGGIERIVDQLITQYTLEGHDVLLIANAQSNSKYAKTIYSWPGTFSRKWGDILKNSFFLYKVVSKEKPDIIHSFSRLLYLYWILLFKNRKVVQSYQRAINRKSTGFAAIIGRKNLTFTACGAHLFKNLNSLNWVAIHNFTDFTFYEDDLNVSKDFLFFLGRIEDIKGTHEAILAAKIAKKKLIIAGNIPNEHQFYFKNKVEPYLDGHEIKYVGPVNDEEKKYLFQRTQVFLFPIKWEEPFGIVMAEALACGVPIVAFRRGSAPEVIQEGVNGYLVENVEEMADAIHNALDLNRVKIRMDGSERFSANKIAIKYLNLFKSHLKS